MNQAAQVVLDEVLRLRHKVSTLEQQVGWMRKTALTKAQKKRARSWRRREYNERFNRSGRDTSNRRARRRATPHRRRASRVVEEQTDLFF